MTSENPKPVIKFSPAAKSPKPAFAGKRSAIQQNDNDAIFADCPETVAKEEFEQWKKAHLIKGENETEPFPSSLARKDTKNTAGLLNTDQAAKYLGLGVSTLERHRCRGTGPLFVRLGNSRSIRYRRSDLDDWGQLSRSTSDVL